jgi:hypothetical protein
MPSRLVVRFTAKLGESVSVSGETRNIGEETPHRASYKEIQK